MTEVGLSHPQAPSKGRITDLVTNGRALVQEVTEFLRNFLPKLEPVSTQTLEAKGVLTNFVLCTF